MIQGKAHFQQKTALKYAGRHIAGRADGPQQDGIMLAERSKVCVGQELPVFQVTTRPQVIVRCLNVVADRVQNLQGFCSYFRADTVATNHCEFHFAGFLSHHMDVVVSVAPQE